MSVTTSDARRILTTDLAPLIRRVQDVARRRLSDVETQAARKGFTGDYAEAFVDAAERGEPRPAHPDRKWHEDDDEPNGAWYWWDEPCWGELIQALRSYSLEGQTAVLEQHLRRVLRDGQAVIRPTFQELEETERVALREILQLCDQWLAPASEDDSHEMLDRHIERLDATSGKIAENLGPTVDELRTRPLNPVTFNVIADADDLAYRPGDESPSVAVSPKKAKRSTERGEGPAKLKAALTKHHKYADGGCLNLEPVGNNELARLADVSESTASAFFSKQFGGHAKYRTICADKTRLVTALKLFNQEFTPHRLFGAKPPDEGECEDDD